MRAIAQAEDVPRGPERAPRERSTARKIETDG